MRYTYELLVSFTREQVQQFGEMTGDNGPVHSVDGIVQGGFILSMLPKWLNQVIKNNNLNKGFDRSVSMILNARFRNKLHSDKLVKVSFSYEIHRKTISKMEWRVFDDELEYCFGTWVIHRS